MLERLKKGSLYLSSERQMIFDFRLIYHK